MKLPRRRSSVCVIFSVSAGAQRLLDSSPPPARHEITGPRILPGGLDSLLFADRTSFDLPWGGIHRSHISYTHTHTHTHTYVCRILVERAPTVQIRDTCQHVCVWERLESWDEYTKPTRHIGHVLLCRCRVYIRDCTGVIASLSIN